MLKNKPSTWTFLQILTTVYKNCTASITLSGGKTKLFLWDDQAQGKDIHFPHYLSKLYQTSYQQILGKKNQRDPVWKKSDCLYLQMIG